MLTVINFLTILIRKVPTKSISTNTEDGINGPNSQWPFGQHAVYKVTEVEMPEFHEPGDFQIVANPDVS